MAWWFSKKDKEVAVQPGHEEISEKRTTKIGYILLIVMASFLIGIAQTIFNDLGKIPERPASVSVCSRDFVSLIDPGYQGGDGNLPYEYSYNMYGGSLEKQQCTFSRHEDVTGISALIRAAYPDLARYYSLQQKISQVERELMASNRSRTTSRENYDIGLQEKQAGITTQVIDPRQAGTAFEATNQDVMTLESQKKALVAEQSQILSKMKHDATGSTEKYKQAQALYKTAFNWYRIYVFLLSLLFVLPLFLLCLKKYSSWKREDSPYTIIVGAALIAFGILLLQVVGMFLYEIIPRRLLELFLEFFQMFAFLRYVLYYGSVLLVIGLFGGIVYYIQKKVFNKSAVAIRALKNKKCPNCEFSIDISMKHCPKCGHALQSECFVCHGLKFRDLPVCYHCGSREM